MRIRAAGLAAGAGVFLWSSLIERNLPVLRTETLPVLKPGSKKLKVLHLSDLHLAPWQHGKMQWVRKLRSLNPDVVVLTGDLVGHKNVLDEVTYTLLPFSDVPGVFVHGSNDYYSPVFKNPVKYVLEPSRLSTRMPDIDTPRLNRILTETLGFKNLNNNALDLSVAGRESVRFLGLGDPHIRYDEPQQMLDRLDTLSPGSPLTLGVVHAPYSAALNTLLEAGSEIIFAGHTHGGQVRVPFYGALTSNSDLAPKKARGLSVWAGSDDAAFLHVSAGLGTSIYAPVRFFCRPEASLLTLTSV